MMRKRNRLFRWLVVCAVGVTPGFVMRCDKAALNVQRTFYEGLGVALSEALVDQGLLTLADDSE